MTLYFLPTDVETFGLDERKHATIEIHTELKMACEGKVAETIDKHVSLIEPFVGAMAQASEFALDMHRKNGLLERVVGCGNWVDQVEADILEMIDKHVSKVKGEDKIVILGNSVHFDVRFIKKHMPKLHERLHYHQLDVTSFAYAFQYFGHMDPWDGWEKKKAHTASEDIAETLQELDILGRKAGML